jgi:hypothetical protein
MSPSDLPLPPQVASSPASVEVLRAWVLSSGDLVCSVSASTWKDPSYWGMLLADVARHAANAMHGAHGLPAEESLRQMAHLFCVELSHPTDTLPGSFS